MDLFAGNFNAFDDKESGAQNGTWSDFANFDDAFTGVDAAAAAPDTPAVEMKNNFDDVFGGANDHAILLEEMDSKSSNNEPSEQPKFGDIPSAGSEAQDSQPQETAVS